MISVKNNIVSCTKTKALTPKQRHQLSLLTEGDKQRYLMSLLGLTKGSVYIQRTKSASFKSDVLANKSFNSVLNKMLYLKRLDREHSPSDRHVGQWVGVEIECFLPGLSNDECNCEYDDDGDRTYECSSCDGTNEGGAISRLRTLLANSGITRATVKNDGSLKSEEGCGVEVTLLFNTAHGFEPLKKLCDVLNNADCFVNKTCGLHVHLDVRHLKPRSVKKIAQSLGNSLPVLKWAVDNSRHDNHYCKMAVGPFSRNREHRYHAINLCSYFEFKTIEVRMHGGSTNYKKIKSWIELIRLIGSSDIKEELTTFQELLDVTDMPDTLVEYMEKRIERLNPTAWPRIMSSTIEELALALNVPTSLTTTE